MKTIVVLIMLSTVKAGKVTTTQEFDSIFHCEIVKKEVEQYCQENNRIFDSCVVEAKCIQVQTEKVGN